MTVAHWAWYVGVVNDVTFIWLIEQGVVLGVGWGGYSLRRKVKGDVIGDF